MKKTETVEEDSEETEISLEECCLNLFNSCMESYRQYQKQQEAIHKDIITDEVYQKALAGLEIHNVPDPRLKTVRLNPHAPEFVPSSVNDLSKSYNAYVASLEKNNAVRDDARDDALMEELLRRVDRNNGVSKNKTATEEEFNARVSDGLDKEPDADPDRIMDRIVSMSNDEFERLSTIADQLNDPSVNSDALLTELYEKNKNYNKVPDVPDIRTEAMPVMPAYR